MTEKRLGTLLELKQHNYHSQTILLISWSHGMVMSLIGESNTTEVNRLSYGIL